MQAVILAAGEGQRLGALTEARPKPMLPVGNEPILESVVEAAVAAGVDEVILVVGYGHERIQSHFGDGDEWGVPIRYVRQDHQLGAAHALAQVADETDGPFVLLHGDQLVDASLIERLCGRFEETGRPAIAAVRSERPTEYGAITLDGEAVVAVSGAPTDDPPFLVNAGAYVLDERAFEAVEGLRSEEGSDLGMAAALQRLADGGDLTAVLHRGAWQDLTYPWDLLATNATLLREDARAVDGDGVHDSAVVAADVAVAPGVSVGPNATLSTGVSLGRNVRVGSNVALSNCIVMQGAEVGDGAALEDCIVAEGATVGPNVTVEGGPATVEIGDTLHRSVGLGGVIGDWTRIGGGATLTPGTVVGREVRAESGTVLDGRIASDETVRRG